MDKFTLLQIATNLDLSSLKFEGQGGGSNPVFIGILGALLLAVLCVVVYLMWTRRVRMLERSALRDEARLRLLFSEAGLEEQDRESLAALAESNEARDLMPLMSIRTAFEGVVEQFRQNFPGHAALRKVPRLRQRLGYGFGNPRNPFTSTRMLPAGIRMQCTIPHPKRTVRYLTAIIGINEASFYVRPPTSRGKAVDLTRFSELNFSVSRENDAEYEFDAKILGQTQHGAPAVAIEHTTAIRKLLYRAAPRSPVSIDGHFFVVKEEFASEKRHKAFKRNESQFSLPGHIVDLSLGGLRIMAVAPETRPAEGDIIVFQLPQARIKDDLVAEVLYTESPTPNEFQMHLRFVGIKELDRLKLNKYLQMQRESEQEAEAQASAAQ